MINFSYMKRLKAFRLVTSQNKLKPGKNHSGELYPGMGLKWLFRVPVFDFYSHKMHSKQDSDIILAEICKLLNKGVIAPTVREDDDFL